MTNFSEMLLVLMKDTGINREDALDLYELFFKVFSKHYEAILNAIHQRDFITVKNLAHQIKGSSANLRMFHVDTLSAQLESNAEALDAVNCLALLNQLAQQVNTIKSEYIKGD